jgi:hypothetical protein
LERRRGAPLATWTPPCCPPRKGERGKVRERINRRGNKKKNRKGENGE